MIWLTVTFWRSLRRLQAATQMMNSLQKLSYGV